MEFAKINAPTSNPFSLFKELELGLESIRIGQRETQLGEEICLVQRSGFCLRDCLTEIDKVGERLHGRPIFHRDSPYLFADKELDAPAKVDLSFGVLPVVPNTACRYTHGDLKQILGDKWSKREGLLEDYTMKDILSRHKLDWVPREVLAVVAGAYRLGRGFPDTAKIGLGCYNDPGVCFRGNAVFGSSGCLAVGAHRDGIFGFVHGFEAAKEATLDDKRFQTVAAGFCSSSVD